MTTPGSILTVDLYEVATVTLDSNGQGIASISPFGPRNGGLRWVVDSCSVRVTSNVAEAQAVCFVSYGLKSTDSTAIKGQSSTGSSGDTCGLGVTLRPNDYVSIQWLGGDVGAIATMTLLGTIYPPGT